MKCAIHPEREAVTTCQHAHEEVVTTLTDKGKKVFEKKAVLDCNYGMCEECAQLNAKICPTCLKFDAEKDFQVAHAKFQFSLLGLVLTSVVLLAVLGVWLFARDNFIATAATFAIVTAVSFVTAEQFASRVFKKTFNIYVLAAVSLLGLALTPILFIYFIVTFALSLSEHGRIKLAASTAKNNFDKLVTPPATAE